MTAKKTQATQKSDPFGVKKSGSKSTTVGSIAVEDPEVRKAIDAFAKAKEEEKKVKADLATYGKTLRAHGLLAFTERQIEGVEGNFNMQGDNGTCQFQVQSKCKAKSVDDIAELEELFPGIEDIFTEDNASLKINAAYLESNWDRLIDALTSTLSPEDFANLFSARTMKVVPGFMAQAQKLVEDKLGEKASKEEVAKELSRLYSVVELTTVLKK